MSGSRKVHVLSLGVNSKREEAIRKISNALMSLIVFAGSAHAGTVNAPKPLKVLQGEQFENRTLKLLPGGDIVYVSEDRAVIGGDGKIRSLGIDNRYTTIYDPVTKTTTTRCIGSQVTASIDGQFEASFSLGGCVSKSVLAGGSGGFVALVNAGGTYALIPGRRPRRLHDIPVGAEMMATTDGEYYMIDAKREMLGAARKLYVYHLDSGLGVVNRNTVDQYADAPHLALDVGNRPHISYYNTRDRMLKYARLVGEKFEVYALDLPDTGINNAIDVDAGEVVVASYFFRNTYNKGVAVYRIPLHQRMTLTSIERCYFIRRRDEDIGWTPSISSNGSAIALSFYNKTRDQTEVYRLHKAYFTALNSHEPEWLESWMLDHKELHLYAEFGYNRVSWETKVSTDFDNLEGVTINSGDFKLDPTYVQEIGFGGEYRQTSFAFDYMKNRFVDEAASGGSDNTSADYVAAMIGLENIIGYGRTLEFHAKRGTFEGEYESRGQIETFNVEYLDYDFQIYNKQGYDFWGVSYRKYQTPQPVIVSLNSVVQEQYVTDVNFDIYSIMYGVSTLNYVRRYTNKYNGFYIDGKVYIGIADLDLERRPSVSAHSPSAFSVRLNGDFGYMVFHRLPALAHTAVFLKAGVNLDYSYISETEVQREEEDALASKATVNIDRQDLLWGVFVKGGLSF